MLAPSTKRADEGGRGGEVSHLKDVVFNEWNQSECLVAFFNLASVLVPAEVGCGLGERVARHVPDLSGPAVKRHFLFFGYLVKFAKNLIG